MGEVSRLYVALVNKAKSETKFGAVRSTGEQLSGWGGECIWRWLTFAL